MLKKLLAAEVPMIRVLNPQFAHRFVAEIVGVLENPRTAGRRHPDRPAQPSLDSGLDGLRGRLLFDSATDVVGDDAEADHSDGALVAAAVETVSLFDDADASPASCAPLLAVAEPALSLLAFSLRAFGRAIGDPVGIQAPGGLKSKRRTVAEGSRTARVAAMRGSFRFSRCQYSGSSKSS